MSQRRKLPHDLEAAEQGIGYSHPPKTSRFEKGRSGNPKGRPPGRHREAPYEAVLGQLIKVRIGGVESEIIADNAFIMKLTKRALEGSPAASRLLTKAFEEDKKVKDNRKPQPPDLLIVPVAPGSATTALLTLGMAKKLDPYRDTARLALEPWLVEESLARLKERRLSPEEQEVVVKATRTPHKVKWPTWWVARP